MIFLHHHLHQALKTEYLTVKDSHVLWSNLYERYGHLRSVILPNACSEWNVIRLQDFKSVHEYNSVLYRITFQLKCVEKILLMRICWKKIFYNISCFQHSSLTII